jgi:hypothetical protein
MLQKLNDLLVSRDFSGLKFWLCDNFLQYWREAELSYQLSSKDYETFTKLLQDSWSLSDENAVKSTPALWAVLNGYPNGYEGRGKPAKNKLTSGHSPFSVDKGRVKLVGFKRVH